MNEIEPKHTPASESPPPEEHMKQLEEVAAGLPPAPDPRDADNLRDMGLDHMSIANGQAEQDTLIQQAAGRLRVLPNAQPDLPPGGLLGDVPLHGMMEIVSDGSVAGTKVTVNGNEIRMLQTIKLEVDAKNNLVVVHLGGVTEDLRVSGAIMQLQRFEEHPETGETLDITASVTDPIDGVQPAVGKPTVRQILREHLSVQAGRDQYIYHTAKDLSLALEAALIADGAVETHPYDSPNTPEEYRMFTLMQALDAFVEQGGGQDE